jgi:2,4-dienoyl-CoA reductase (NADPH2)
MAALLDPLTLGPKVARNRVVFGPHETNLARRRAISERHVAYYRRRAEGGVGVVVVEEASVHPSDWPYERCPLAVEAGPGWAAVASACHDEGALVVAALGHSGGQGSSAYSQAPLWAPSRVPEVSTREVPKWMEAHEIAAVVEGFGAAAGVAVAAGCDGVEVNAGQHSLVRQFLSGLTNQRSDEWGGDRLLFARQVLEAVRRAAGRDVFVGLRLSCDELAPWAGITPEAATGIAVELGAMVDYLTVVRGSIYTVSATRPDGHVEPGFNLGLARAVRAAVPAGSVVVAQGSIVDAAMADAAVQDGTCDLVEMTRAQIADPDLVAKAGTGAAVRPCILCNQTCMARDVRNPVVTCVVEPSSGHEGEDPRLESALEWVVDVLVVGGGIAGLETARVAATLGHRVTLVERSERLGGMLRTAAMGAGRHRLALAADWLEAEVRRLGVDVQLGREVDAAQVEAFDGEVVLCTGSVAGRRTYRVEAGAVVRSADEVLAGAELPEGPVLVWDPIGGPIGISVAERLRAEGRQVALVTPDLIAGNELGRSGDLAPSNVRLQSSGVTIERRTRLRAVVPGEAHVEHRFTGEPRVLPAAAVVDAGYRLPDDRLWRATGESHRRAGDAVAPRTVHDAILEGRRAALSLTQAAPLAGANRGEP